MGHINIYNATTLTDSAAVYLVYCWLVGNPNQDMSEHGIEIKHRANSRLYRVVEKGKSNER